MDLRRKGHDDVLAHWQSFKLPGPGSDNSLVRFITDGWPTNVLKKTLNNHGLRVKGVGFRVKKGTTGSTTNGRSKDPNSFMGTVIYGR